MNKLNIRQTLWTGLGIFFVGLAVLGVVLPLLPATPFVLLASTCFMKGSPRLTQWLYAHPQFGPLLTNWKTHRAISSTVKYRGNICIVISFIISIWFAPMVWLKILLFCLLFGVLFGFNRIPVLDSVAPANEN